MKKLKNEDIKDLKEYNNILFKQGNKTSKNNPNKNLLLFKKEDISKNNLYLNNPKKVNSKLSNIVFTPLNNEHINEIKFINNEQNKNQLINKIKINFEIDEKDLCHLFYFEIIQKKYLIL